jgi:DNA transformation protein and related proteins
MPYDASYLEFVLDQFQDILSGLNYRPMFGGVGLYWRGIFFALIADDTLYIYTAEPERPAREAQGLRRCHRGYYEVPVEVLEDREALKTWAERAIAAKPQKKK